MAAGDILIHKQNESGGHDEVPAGQASTAEMDTGTENSKLATPKNIKDAEYQRIHVGTSAPTDTTKLWLDTN